MHRLLVSEGELPKAEPSLTKEARNHLKVLRPRDGEEIELFDGRGRWRAFRYDRASGGLLPVGPGPLFQPEPSPLTLFACVTKGSRWDWTVEKATELGVTRIVPVVSDRTVVRISADDREAKRLRWRRIAEDAARQSDAKWIPEVLAPVTFAESLALVRGTRCLVGALTDPPSPPIADVLFPAGSSAAPSALYVGPEGDFTPGELAALLEIATPVSFGPNVLRAETAAIFGVGALRCRLDALRAEGA